MSIEDAIRHHEAGRLGEAEGLYRSILSGAPRDPDALHLLGVLLTQRGEYQGAEEHIQAALDVERDSALFQSSLAQAFFRSGKLAEASKMLERVVAQQPDSHQAFSDLGAVYQESGVLDRAIEAYRRSIELNPGLAVVHFNLGTALKQRGSTADAIPCVRKAVAMDASAANYSAILAGYYLEADQPEAALESCRQCLSGAPRNLMALTFLSVALARLGDDKSAARIVDLDRFIQPTRIAAPDGYESISAFNNALATYVRSHPSLKTEPINNATRFGKHTENLLVDPGGPIPALAAAHQPREQVLAHQLLGVYALPGPLGEQHLDLVELLAAHQVREDRVRLRGSMKLEQHVGEVRQHVADEVDPVLGILAELGGNVGRRYQGLTIKFGQVPDGACQLPTGGCGC